MLARWGLALDGRAFFLGSGQALSPHLPAALVLGRRREQNKEPLGLDPSSAPWGLSLSVPQVPTVGMKEEGVCAYSLSTLCSGPQGTPLRWHPSVFLNTVLLLLCVLPGGLLPGKPSFLHQTQKPT